MVFSRNIKVLLVAAFIMALNATAQWSPGSMMVYMGDLNLASHSAFSGAAPYVIGNAQTIQQSLMNNSSANSTAAISKTSLMPLDLSRYAGDRINKSLEGYTNIITRSGNRLGSQHRLQEGVRAAVADAGECFQKIPGRIPGQ